MRPWWISGIAVFNLLLLIPDAAFAGRCVITGPRYNLSSDTVAWSMKIGSGQTCIFGLRYNDIVMERLVLTSSPRYGAVALRGSAVTYTAKSDFEGQDSFAMVISGSIKRMPGSSTIQIDVEVVEVPTRAVLQQENPAAQKRIDTSPALPMQKLAIQVAEWDEKLMNLALNNAKNVIDHYRASGEPVMVEIITFGPGLHMLRADTSPVKDRISAMALEYPELGFVGCAETQKSMSKTENRPIGVISEAKMTTSGVVRLIELQEQGYGYIRP